MDQRKLMDNANTITDMAKVISVYVTDYQLMLFSYTNPFRYLASTCQYKLNPLTQSERQIRKPDQHSVMLCNVM